MLLLNYSGSLFIAEATLRLLTVLLENGVSIYTLAFVLEAGILSTRWNKDCVM